MQFITCAQVGLDSLGAVELRNAVTAAFGISLPVTVTFDYPTVAALAGFVASRMGPAAAVEALATCAMGCRLAWTLCRRTDASCARRTSWLRR